MTAYPETVTRQDRPFSVFQIGECENHQRLAIATALGESVQSMALKEPNFRFARHPGGIAITSQKPTYRERSACAKNVVCCPFLILAAGSYSHAPRRVAS